MYPKFGTLQHDVMCGAVGVGLDESVESVVGGGGEHHLT